MAKNTNLGNAKRAKKDEFYTQMDDIALELRHYRGHFKGKTVFCNCDDPYESNFFKYFALNFNALGLKKLVATCYDGSPITGNELLLQFDTPDSEPHRMAYKVEITEVTDVNGDGAINLADVAYLLQNDKNVLSRLKGNGDFRSDECVELLKEADIVCTNPPFSLFREYVDQLVKCGKKFLIIANKNSLTNKGVFPLIVRNQLWTGFRNVNKDMWFEVTSEEEKVVDARKMKHISACWLTNLEHSKRHETLDLWKHYTPEEYPRYFNYDAIEVGKTADIPCDYDGEMGVPITFLDKYNPNQFEIMGQSLELADMAKVKARLGKAGGGPRFYIEKNGELVRLYERIVIRRRK